jgi:hypothetical protein
MERKTQKKGLTHEMGFVAECVGEIFESIVHSVFEIPIGFVIV